MGVESKAPHLAVSRCTWLLTFSLYSSTYNTCTMDGWRCWLTLCSTIAGATRRGRWSKVDHKSIKPLHARELVQPPSFDLTSCHTTSTMKQSICLSVLMVLLLVSILEADGAKSGELLHPKIYNGQMKRAEILSISPQYFRVLNHHPYYPEARALMYKYFNSQYAQDPHYNINPYLQDYYDDTQSNYQFPYDPTGHGDPQFSFYQG
ncbi:hypothetical protein Pmani_015796 [Petrolisthes manimaculis]|uniref:Uncharacterized protein n=1 Tax=Petrolisthes manimaculis TaxID=1843537 RepID=A0AAE1U7C2_9EUCA|nr:hypothetical protein Pmani_015796 [Petrolisthes manimaculis]